MTIRHEDLRPALSGIIRMAQIRGFGTATALADKILAAEDITVVTRGDLAAVLYMAGLTREGDLGTTDPIVISILADAYYRLDEAFNTKDKTAAEVVSM